MRTAVEILKGVRIILLFIVTGYCVKSMIFLYRNMETHTTDVKGLFYCLLGILIIILIEVYIKTKWLNK